MWEKKEIDGLPYHKWHNRSLWIKEDSVNVDRNTPCVICECGGKSFWIWQDTWETWAYCTVCNKGSMVHGS